MVNLAMTPGDIEINFVDSSAITADRRINRATVQNVVEDNIDKLIDELRCEILAHWSAGKGNTNIIPKKCTTLNYRIVMGSEAEGDYYGNFDSRFKISITVTPV